MNGKKITYERWINLFLPEGWQEHEEMGTVLLEKEGWPGLLQLTFVEREDTSLSPLEAAVCMLEDTLEERDIPFPREAVKAEDRGAVGIAALDYTFQGKETSTHWRIWFLVEASRAIMAAYISAPEHDVPALDEASRIIAELEFVPISSN